MTVERALISPVSPYISRISPCISPGPGLMMTVEWAWVVPRTRMSGASHLMVLGLRGRGRCRGRVSVREPSPSPIPHQVVVMVLGGLTYGMMPLVQPPNISPYLPMSHLRHDARDPTLTRTPAPTPNPNPDPNPNPSQA